MNAFFSSQEKKINIVSLFLFLSFSLSFADASIINARAREGERESFGDDENTVYE